MLQNIIQIQPSIITEIIHKKIEYIKTKNEKNIFSLDLENQEESNIDELD